MIHAQHIGPIEAQDRAGEFELRCIAHYGKVETRVGKYPAKRPIVMPVPATKTPQTRATKYEYDHAAIKLLWQRHLSVSEIARRSRIPRKAMDKFIKKHSVKWGER